MLTHPNRFQWVARYNDGTELKQVVGSKEGTYETINRDKLSGFELWEGSSRVIYIKVNHNENLIWRRRVEMGGSGEIKEVIHLIFKQNKVDPTIKGLVAIFESDSRVEGLGGFIDGHPWAYPIDIHPEEKL